MARLEDLDNNQTPVINTETQILNNVDYFKLGGYFLVSQEHSGQRLRSPRKVEIPLLKYAFGFETATSTLPRSLGFWLSLQILVLPIPQSCKRSP